MPVVGTSSDLSRRQQHTNTQCMDLPVSAEVLACTGVSSCMSYVACFFTAFGATYSLTKLICKQWYSLIPSWERLLYTPFFTICSLLCNETWTISVRRLSTIRHPRRRVTSEPRHPVQSLVRVNSKWLGNRGGRCKPILTPTSTRWIALKPMPPGLPACPQALTGNSAPDCSQKEHLLNTREV